MWLDRGAPSARRRPVYIYIYIYIYIYVYIIYMCVFSVRVLINRGKCRLAIKVDSNVPEEEARVQEVFALVLFVGAHN